MSQFLSVSIDEGLVAKEMLNNWLKKYRENDYNMFKQNPDIKYSKNTYNNINQFSKKTTFLEK